MENVGAVKYLKMGNTSLENYSFLRKQRFSSKTLETIEESFEMSKNKSKFSLVNCQNQ